MPLTLSLKKFPARRKFLRLARGPLRGQRGIAGATFAAPSLTGTDRAKSSLLGQPVFFGSGGECVAGQVARIEGDCAVVKLAVPNRAGLLLVSDTEHRVQLADLAPTRALMQHKRVARFESGVAIAPVTAGEAKFQIVTEPASEVPADYLNVTIEGHASTFGTPADRDRGGDYVLPGAFDATLAEFKTNPVMLTDHTNKVQSIAGSWSRVSIDAQGLGVRGTISNAPDVRSTRFKLVEGHLKGLSIGGIWFYADDGFGIEEARLFEISLVAIPMNPKTLAHTASLGELECRKAFAGYWRTHSALRDAA